jgi:hypothetical protein
MKYDSLKKGHTKTLRVSSLSGGINKQDPPLYINDNQLSDCKNVWLQNGNLQTRKGISCDGSKSLITPIGGYYGENQYKIHNTAICVEGENMRIATAEVCSDDYLYICNVFLISERGDYRAIGKLSFFRTTSDIFYTPINIVFYTGKPQQGGGIFAMVTLQNGYYDDDRYYNFFEISEDFTEWNKIYNFYIPTLYINGRGNKYSIAKANNTACLLSPKILESPNMLNGRFHSYFTSDGYSNSFRLPFANLSSENIVCRIYYTLVDFVEWQVGAQTIADKKSFFGKEVTMEADREKGIVYFIAEGNDYAIPVMDMYHENNIKITATKEIEKGREMVIHSTCTCEYKSRIIVSGGQNGNMAFVTDYQNPLYFPQNSSVEIGFGDSEVVDLAIKDRKIIALKEDSIYSLSLKEGSKINEISLLADNDKLFNESDTFTCDIITNQVGCKYKECTAVLKDKIIFFANDRKVYVINNLNAEGIICVSDILGNAFNDFRYADFAFCGNDKYLIFENNKAFVADFSDGKNAKWHYWEFSDDFKVSGGFAFENTFYFLCAGKNSLLSYIASLNGEKDEFLELGDEGEILKFQKPIKSSITTKHFDFSCISSLKNIESIYIAIACKSNVNISVNGTEIADLNLRLTDDEYDKKDYKSVKLKPYLNNKNSIYLTLSSNGEMSIGELEIIYRKIG